MKPVALLCSAALMFYGSIVSAELYTGGKFRTGLRNSVDQPDNLSLSEQFDAVFAYAYLRGTIETAVAAKFLCIPQGATDAQMNAMVLKALDEHPELWQEAASMLSLAALEPWLCAGWKDRG